MRIARKFKITGVQAQQASNAPLILKIEGGGPIGSSVTLDRNTSIRHQIPISLDLLGRTLEIAFESWEIPQTEEGGRAFEALGADDVLGALVEKRKFFFHSELLSLQPRMEISRVATFHTMQKEVPYSPLPCPLYEVTLDLMEEEYLFCLKLSRRTVFRVSMALK